MTQRKTRLIPYEGDMSAEDLIAREDVVVTVTRGGYAKRTKTDLYRSQKRGGRGVQGAALREDDIVEHFFVTTTHHWLLFFTNRGRVYRAKAHELPEQARTARGPARRQHPGVPARRADRAGDGDPATTRSRRTWSSPPRKAWSRRPSSVAYDSNRTGGLAAVNLREGDELIAAQLCSDTDDLLLVSKGAMSIRFHADDAQLRPMGRQTSGVIGMRFRPQ